MAALGGPRPYIPPAVGVTKKGGKVNSIASDLTEQIAAKQLQMASRRRKAARGWSGTQTAPHPNAHTPFDDHRTSGWPKVDASNIRRAPAPVPKDSKLRSFGGW